MKKAFDQTVRDLKREVNKKVLKVPTIEQKILDATSNEPWGPHGSNLADISQATRNYHEYQMIINVIWKRINDTGKNWRHVYKALTVLEYLVAHGSERVIDDIREHAYQISTLSDFQYIDSSGRDQGSNVRRKSQSLVSLVNDKERIAEVRQKANANKDKYRSTFSTGRTDSYSSPGGYGDRYDDDRYEGRYRDEDRYGSRKDNYRDDDRYNRGGYSYGRDGDQYGRDAEDRYGRDNYREDDYKGGRNNDDGQYDKRKKSLDRDRSGDDDDDRYSSRSGGGGGGGRGDETSHNERLERRFSEQSVGGLPSYEEATKETQVHLDEENGRNGGDGGVAAPKASSPPAPKASSSFGSTNQEPRQGLAEPPQPAGINGTDGFDEFDPRSAIPGASVAPNAENSLEMDLFGPAPSDPIYSLALMPISSSPAAPEADVAGNSGFGENFAAAPSSMSFGLDQSNANPFGDAPFQATHESFPAQPESSAPVTSFQSFAPDNGVQTLPSLPPKTETTTSFDFENSFGGLSFAPATNSQQNGFSNFSNSLPEVTIADTNNGSSGPTTGSAGFLPSQTAQPAPPAYAQQPAPPAYAQQPAPPAYAQQPAPPAYAQASFTPQLTTAPNPAAFPPEVSAPQPTNGFLGGLTQQAAPFASVHTAQPTIPAQMPTHMRPQSGTTIAVVSQTTGQYAPQTAAPMGAQYNLLGQTGLSAPEMSAPAMALPLAKQPSKEKFEMKSSVWTDTLSRGLVNLNISGPKINPHADIGVDFDSINRKEKRTEDRKSTAAPMVSTITMGKAMGSGSGIGRVGASGMAPAPPPNTAMNPGMGMGVGMGMGNHAGMGMGMGMGMGAYGAGMNQPMGMGMNMGMNQGMPMRPPMNGAVPPGTGMPGVGYNQMTGMGGYNPHMQYGGRYR